MTTTNDFSNHISWYAVSTGTGSAYKVHLPALGFMPEGMAINMKAHAKSAASATIQVNDLDAVSIKSPGGAAIAAGAIPVNGVAQLVFDGTAFQLAGVDAASGASDSSLIDINTSNLFRLYDAHQTQHAGAQVVEQGWLDSFGTADQQGADQSGSTGEQHDATNKLYEAAPSGTNLNADQNFTTEANYLTHHETGTTASISGDTVTITTGSFGDNVVGARFSPENPFNPANSAKIISRAGDGMSIDLEANHGFSGSDLDWSIRFFEIDSGVARLSEYTGTAAVTESDTGSGGSSDVRGETGSDERIAQEFKANSAGSITSAILKMEKQGTPTDNYYFEIQSSTTPTAVGGAPTNTVLATTAAQSTAALTTTMTEKEHSFTTPFTPTLNNYYHLVCRRTAANDGVNNPRVQQQTSGTYPDGQRWQRDSGTWVAKPSDHYFKIKQTPVNNVIDEYIPIWQTEGNLADASIWLDENGLSQTPANPTNVNYIELFATAGFGPDTIGKITDGASGNVRPVITNSSGIWRYNVNTTFGSTTWQDASVNSMAQAIRDAMTVTENQMDGATRAATPDSAILLDQSKKRGTIVVLYSTTNGVNPEVDQTRINYDADGVMDLRSRTFNPGLVPSRVFLWAVEEHTAAEGGGTFYVSRDGGANWTVISMTEVYQTSTDVRVKRATLDVSSQPSGQDVRCRYVTVAGKNQKLHSWGLQARK